MTYLNCFAANLIRSHPVDIGCKNSVVLPKEKSRAYSMWRHLPLKWMPDGKGLVLFQVMVWTASLNLLEGIFVRLIIINATRLGLSYHAHNLLIGPSPFHMCFCS